MILTLLVWRPCAAQDRNPHHRSFKSGSENRHHLPQEEVARPFFFFFFFWPRHTVLWSLKKWLTQGMRGRVEGRTFEPSLEGKCSLMKSGKMQMNGFLRSLCAPRYTTPSLPPPACLNKNKSLSRRGLFITTELFVCEVFPVLIFRAIYSFSPVINAT